MSTPRDYQYARYAKVIDRSISLQRAGHLSRARKARFAAWRYFAYLFWLNEGAKP